MIRTMSRLLLGLILLMAFSAPATAKWRLDLEQSELNFLSTKKSHITEIHQFEDFNVTVDVVGNTQITVNLASVNTLIPIRDERMKKFLFQISEFPKATLTTKVDANALRFLKVGQMKALELPTQLRLHGVEKEISLKVRVVAIEGGLHVTTTQPVLIDARDFKLSEGVDKLQSLAALPSISYTVPVFFSITLNKI